MDSYFAVAAPGIEPFTAEELLGLGLGPIFREPGGVTFKGDLEALYKANLQLRTASRILARIGNFFYARTFVELQRRAESLPWDRYLTPGQPISLRVTCHRSKLYHSDAVARTISAAIASHLGKSSPLIKPDDEGDQPPQLIIVRLADDRCTVSVDSSGTLLHKRGYRQAVAKAPLRETLAAAMLMASAWDKASPLLDPFCGSGTIPIEAALLSLGIPPGLHRRFAFMDWPNYDPLCWQEVSAFNPSPVQDQPILLASDRDQGAVRMSRLNAERAGVASSIEFTCQAVSAISPPQRIGWVVTNPPYGLRLGEGRDLRNLYAQFGNVMHAKCPGWHLGILCSDRMLLGQTHIDLDTSAGIYQRWHPRTVGKRDRSPTRKTGAIMMLAPVSWELRGIFPQAILSNFSPGVLQIGHLPTKGPS